MSLRLKKRTLNSAREDAFSLSQSSPSALLPGPAFAPHLFSSKRRLFFKRLRLGGVSSSACACLAVAITMSTVLLLLVLLHVFFPELQWSIFGWLLRQPATVVPPHTLLRAVVPVEPYHVAGSATVALIVPVMDTPAADTGGPSLLHALLGSLLLSEDALCYPHPTAADVALSVRVAVVSRVAADVLRAAVEAVVVGGSSLDGEFILHGETDNGGELTPNTQWRMWQLNTTAVRGVLDAATTAPEKSSTRRRRGSVGGGCFGDVVTVVSRAVDSGTTTVVVAETAAEVTEMLVDAGLRTPAGRAGTHFVVLPPFLRGSRMPYTEPDDVAESRLPGSGLLPALLRTATAHNGGRVAAAQCTVLAAEQDTVHDTTDGALTMADLLRLTVVDKGGLTASTQSGGMLLPFLTRRRSGFPAVDQRATWEERIDAASLHCGVFYRPLYNAVGGLAGVWADAAVQAACQSATAAAAPELRPAMAVVAPDRGWWVLSLRMQAAYPHWQVWASRAVAVADSRVAAALVPTLSMLDEFGQSVDATVTELQRQRVGVAWRLRGGVNATAALTAAEAAMFPASLRYFSDFTEPCCGLSREAMGYVRPLMERYAIAMVGARTPCPRPGNALLDLAYNTPPSSVWRTESHTLTWKDASPAVQTFYQQRLAARARIHFQHWRGYEYRWGLIGNKRTPPTLSVGHSLSELSNIPREWVMPMRERTDLIFATADFFAHIYRRNKIAPAKVRIVPEAVDVYEYDPANYVRQPTVVVNATAESFDSLPHLTSAQRLQRFVFFSNFKWEDRKGWDVLLGAYWDAFGPAAPPALRNRTTLVIKTKFEASFTRGVTQSNIVRFIEAWGRLGSLRGMTSIDDFPHIIVLGTAMGARELAQLYANADAFVFPSKAEGWGLPATEAMAMALPVLLPQWGGLRTFATPDTCFRIPLDGLEEIAPDSPYGYSEGMKMSLPSRDKTAELMQYVLQHPEHARRVGRRARAMMVREMSEEAVADVMDRIFVEEMVKKVRG